MNLRTRIALIVSLVALGSTAGGFAFHRFVVYRQFLELERRSALDDFGRCNDALRRERHHLALWCGDWAGWDDTYEFVEDHDEKYAAANLVPAVLSNVRCNAVWYVDRTGAVVRSVAYDLETGEKIDFPELPRDRFPPSHPLLANASDTEAVSGIVRTARGPLLVASRKILTSDLKGPPRGWFLCGRLLSPGAVRTLASQTRVSFWIRDVRDPALDLPTRSAIATSPPTSRPVLLGGDDEDADTLGVLGVLRDIDGRPSYVVCAEVPRSISAEGAQSMRLATISLAVAGGGTVAVLLFLLGIGVVAPVQRLTDHALRIGADGDLAVRSGIERADEIGTLARAFDTMVERLEASRAQVADAARRAGMADVARGVLHNAGNVLTGINVSAATIAGTLRKSRLDGIEKAVGMLQANRASLGRFVEEDAAGRKIPDYLAKAVAGLRDEQAAVLAETLRLQAAVEKAVALVQRQGELARGPGLSERVSLRTLVAESLQLVETTLRRDGIASECRIEPDVTVRADRSKVSQILVNLLTNAREALAGAKGEKRIVVEAAVRAGRVVIGVRDTGCGISADALPHLFENGFTTKCAGRGLGLHYCATTAGELGGSLTVTSDGPDRGAVFTLEFPAGPDGAESPAGAPAPMAALHA